jgi:hypothetical protein
MLRQVGALPRRLDHIAVSVSMLIDGAPPTLVRDFPFPFPARCRDARETLPPGGEVAGGGATGAVIGDEAGEDRADRRGADATGAPGA